MQPMQLNSKKIARALEAALLGQENFERSADSASGDRQISKIKIQGSDSDFVTEAVRCIEQLFESLVTKNP